MKQLNVYVEGENKNGEKVSTKAYNFPKNADVMDIMRTMKCNGFFRDWKYIDKVFNLDNMKLIKEF